MDFLHSKGQCVFQLWVILLFSTSLICSTNARTTTPSAPTQKPTSWNNEVTLTSLERPPLRPSEKQNGNTDDSGVTLPPLKTDYKSKLRTFLDRVSLKDSVHKWRKLFSRLDKVISGRLAHHVGEGRYMESWMEGAMVPMTFLLMAAFIMDILQRLFPLPYASFVQQHWAGSEHYAALATTTPKPPDLSKFQLKTPLGSFGIETNDRKKLKLFGRSNAGNPPVVTSSGDSPNDQMLNSYLMSLLSSNSTQEASINTDYEGSEWLNGVGNSYQTFNEDSGGAYYSPGVDYDSEWLGRDSGHTQAPKKPDDTDQGSKDSFSKDQMGGGRYGSKDSFSKDQMGAGGYGSTDNSNMSQTSGYGSTNMHVGSVANSMNFVSNPTSNSNTKDPLAGGSSLTNVFDHIPLDKLDLLEYYSKLNDGNNPWKRKKRHGIHR